jgi:hypothetical protein
VNKSRGCDHCKHISQYIIHRRGASAGLSLPLMHSFIHSSSEDTRNVDKILVTGTEGQRHYATSRKVAGSIPDEVIGYFSLPNPSSHTMALGSTQPLTEISTRNIPGG